MHIRSWNVVYSNALQLRTRAHTGAGSVSIVKFVLVFNILGILKWVSIFGIGLSK